VTHNRENIGGLESNVKHFLAALFALFIAGNHVLWNALQLFFGESHNALEKSRDDPKAS